MHADWTALRSKASAPGQPRKPPARRPRRDRSRRRGGSAWPAPAPPRRERSCRSRPESSLPSVVIDHDRPDFDRAFPCAGNTRRNSDRGVEILGLDQIIAAELFARLRKWTVGGEDLAIAHAHGCGRGRRLQAVTSLEVSALDNGLGEAAIFAHHFLAGGGVHLAEFGFVSVDQQ